MVFSAAARDIADRMAEGGAAPQGTSAASDHEKPIYSTGFP